MNHRLARALGLLAFGALWAGCAGNSGAPCDPACSASTQLCCDGDCVFHLNDVDNCGACGNECAAGQICREGACVVNPTDGGVPSMCFPSCTTTQRCCGTICVNREQPRGTDGRPANPADTVSAFNNCNGCGITCDPERAISCSIPSGGTAMSTPQCLCGDLQQCLVGELCVQEGAGYTCISTSTDVNNCGAIGNACATGERCDGGMCVCGTTGGRCAEGQGCCMGACIDVTSDAANCGACGNACGENGPDCVAGQCRCGTGPACDPPTLGMLPTPSDPGASCCSGACVPNTNTSCGCGIACEGDDECIVSGGSFLPGGPAGEPTVCCGQDLIITQICSDTPFPFDGGFGGVDAGFGFDAGVPFDAGP